MVFWSSCNEITPSHHHSGWGADLLPFFEDIANTTNGMNQLQIMGIIHLAPEPAHSSVDDGAVAIEIDVLHLLCDSSARQYFARMSQEVFQQPVFLGCQIKLMPRPPHPMGNGVQCCQHNDGGILIAFTDPLEHRPAITLGHDHIQHNLSCARVPGRMATSHSTLRFRCSFRFSMPI